VVGVRGDAVVVSGSKRCEEEEGGGNMISFRDEREGEERERETAGPKQMSDWPCEDEERATSESKMRVFLQTDFPSRRRRSFGPGSPPSFGTKGTKWFS